MSAVAPQLARDRALMTADQRCDLRLVMFGFLQRVYLVSLFTSKLRIAHLCASFDLAVDRARLNYRSLLLTTNLKVALHVESTICQLRLTS